MKGRGLKMITVGNNEMFSLKYRPKSFSEIVGQEPIIREMENRSLSMNFPQIMLFSGPTGTGKTSTWHIVSALLVCSNPTKEKDPFGNEFLSPCSECGSSIASISDRKRGFWNDIWLYNASTLGKATVEELIESTYYPPWNKNRVIVVEEFQELLSSRSNGLLYTLLEERRKNIYFIFITMDVSKMKQPLQDRCMHYRFQPVQVPEIVTYLHRVLEKADLISTVPDYFITKGLSQLAENANGSVRNAVQALERCVSGKFYSTNSIEKNLGYSAA
jgi:DNA polymerase-3 subunit gamma/tau